MYIHRTIESAIERVNKSFGVVMIIGPRQVGKTTVFKNCDPDRRYVSLDLLPIRKLARESPELFLQRYRPPVLIDEIQYAPELLPYIKAMVDESGEKGMFWITGSQQFNLMRGVSESLAGRVGLLNLQGFSLSELSGRTDESKFLPTQEWQEIRSEKCCFMSKTELYETMWRGFYPALNNDNPADWEDFYRGYVQTYIERDIREITNIGEEIKFLDFLTALAARTGQLLNFSDLARDLEKSLPTIQRWVSMVQTVGLIYLMYPFSRNISNRMTKMPKLYFMDTGLACYLAKWLTPETLENGAQSGAMFENFVVSAIIKSYINQGRMPNISFYRDKDKREIDVILEQNGLVYPVEIKRKDAPDRGDVKNFELLEKAGLNVGEGAVICNARTHMPLTEKVSVIPAWYL